MDPATLKLIVVSTLTAGLASLAALLAAWWPTPAPRALAGAPQRPVPGFRALAPAAILVLCATALYPMVFQTALPDFPPARGRFAPPYAALAASLGAVLWLGSGWCKPTIKAIVRTIVAIALAALVIFLVLHNQLAAADGWSKWWPLVACSLVLQATMGTGLVTVARRQGPARASVVFVVAFATSQILVLGYHSISECIMASALCAAVGGLFVASLLRPAATLGAPGALVLTALLSTLLLQGAAFGVSDMPWRLLFAVAVTIAPWCALLAEAAARSMGIRTPWARTAALLAGAAIPALGAVGVAGKLYMADASAY